MRGAQRTKIGPNSHSELRLCDVLAASGDIAYEWDVATGAIRWFGNAKPLFGLDPKGGPTHADAFNARINPEDMSNRLRRLNSHFRHRHSYDVEYRIAAPNGEFLWVHDCGAAAFCDKGAPVRMTGVLRVVTDRKLREAQLEHIANFDSLTGRFNKQRLLEGLDNALSYAQRYQIEGAYLQVGIDKLGMVNSVFGYETADAILIGIGHRLDRHVRTTDIIGRVGGDRFGIVLGHCPYENLDAAANNILQATANEPIDTPNGPVYVTISIGIVPFPGAMATAHDVMTNADTALAEAKELGRNCYVCYEPSETQRNTHLRSMSIVEKVQTALKQDALALAFQPVVDSKTHKVDHYECLMRMRADDGSYTVAGKFIPVVEQMGLIKQVDQRAFELTVAELNRHPDVRLAFNVSALTASDRNWRQRLLAQLENRRDIASRLVVEITETAALNDIEESAHLVSSLRDLGCQVALDDFGAGHTSLRYIKFLATDVVKIDGFYVRNIATNLDNQLFVRTLLGMAQSFGLRTVAEFVETAEDADILTRQGVDYLQGYYFGAPSMARPWLGESTKIMGCEAPPLLAI